MKTKLILLAMALCLLAPLGVTAHAGDAPELAVEPQTIHIDAMYNGTTLHVKGSIPADSDLVLRFLGASCDLHMKEKGKVLGMMWMNLDSLVFNHIPSVCIVNAAELSDPSGNTSDSDKAIDSLRLGALTKDATIEGGSATHERAFDELIKLKKQEGLYREVSGNISYGPPADGKKTFQADIPVPSRLNPGDYVVEMSTIRNGSIQARTVQPIAVKLVGVPAFLASLAFGHSALYGILATLIAIMSGLAIGVVFQSKGAH